MARVGTVTLATTAYVAANAVTVDAINAVKSAIAEGKGYPLKLNPTPFSGTGGDAEFNLTMPGDVPITTGHKYGVSGVFFVRDAGGGTVIGTRVIRDAVIRADFSGFMVMERAGDSLVGDKHATFGTYFAADDDFPTLGAAFGPQRFTAVWNVILAQNFTVEFDGTLSDLGADS